MALLVLGQVARIWRQQIHTKPLHHHHHLTTYKIIQEEAIENILNRQPPVTTWPPRPLTKLGVRRQTRHEAVITMKMILISYINQVDLLQWQVLTTCRTVPDREHLSVMSGNRLPRPQRPRPRFNLDCPRRRQLGVVRCEAVNPCRCLCPNLPINFWETKFTTIKVRHI